MTKPFDPRSRSGATREDEAEDRVHNREADLDSVWEHPSEGLFIRLDPVATPERSDVPLTRDSGPSKEDI